MIVITGALTAITTGKRPLGLNLGEALENVNREPDAVGAYRNAGELFQAMGLDIETQDCDRAIERLSQPQVPVAPRRGFWTWLSRLWCWLKRLWQ